MEKRKNITIEGAKIIFRNFAGREGRFNPEGNRNFCVVLDPEFADELKEDGWNIKYPNVENGKDLLPYLQVKVSFKRIPPKIVVISSTGKRQLSEEKISDLDWMAFEKVDIIISPYNYDIRGNSGVSAYLKSFYGTLMEDELELKYAGIPESTDNLYEDD